MDPIARRAGEGRWLLWWLLIFSVFLAMGAVQTVQAQVQAGTVRVDYAPQISGRLEGSLQQMRGESVNFNSGAVLTGMWYVPGSPNVQLNDQPNFGGVTVGTGAATPSGWTITLNSESTVGGLTTRTDAVGLPVVPDPSAGYGSQNVTLNSPSDATPNWANVRDLTLNSNAGNWSVPAGVYKRWTLNAAAPGGVTLGVTGASEPVVYELEELTLNANSRVTLLGPVVIHVRTRISINAGAVIGEEAHPEWLTLRVARQNLVDNAQSVIYAGRVEVDEGQTMINGQVYVTGELWTARLTVNSSAKLSIQGGNNGGGSNEVPVADAQTLTTPEDTALAVTLTGSDADGDVLTYSLAQLPQHGTLSGSVPNVTYTPNENYHGPDSFTFTVNDGSETSTPATVSITVTPVNDAPIAVTQAVTTEEDTALPIVLTGTDIDGDALTFAIVDLPQYGTLSGTGPNITYTPSANYHGADSLAFTVNDGTETSAPASVSITVASVYDAPEAVAQTVTTPEDIALGILLAGTDIDGNMLTYSIVDQPQHGTLSGTGANVTYTPSEDYYGTDSFTFAVNDGTLTSASATVGITVTPVNDAPVAVAQTVTTGEDTALLIVLTGTDVDGDALTFAVVDQPQHGTFSGTGANITYTPSADFHGADSFTFTVSDGPLTSAPATVSIAVTPRNDEPVAVSQTVSTPEDTALEIVLVGTDADEDVLTFAVDQPSKGVLTGTAPNLIYTPNANSHGPDSFTFTVHDGALTSGPATVSISVTPVNDAPVAVAQAVTTPEGTALDIVLMGTDVDDDTLTYAIVDQPQHGTLSGTGPNVTYTPSADYHGTDSFTFLVNDGTASSAPAMVSISVNQTGDNVPPVAQSLEFDTPKDTPVKVVLRGTDAEGDVLTYTVVNGPRDDSLTGTAPGLMFVPRPFFEGTVIFYYVVSDGTATSNKAQITIRVGNENSGPVAFESYFDFIPGVDTPITLTGEDPDGDALTYAVVAPPKHGTLSGKAPNLTYQTEVGSISHDEFTFILSDGRSFSESATVHLYPVPGSNPVVANPIAISTPENTPVNIQLSVGGGEDPANMYYDIITPPQHGTLGQFELVPVLPGVRGPAPKIRYNPAKGFSGTDSFEFQVQGSNTSTAIVTIEVTPVEDAPLALGQNLTVEAGIACEITLEGIDPEGQPLTFDIVAASSHGELVGSGNSYTYVSEPGYLGLDRFSFRVTDAAGLTDTANVHLNVVEPGVNTPPVASSTSVTLKKDVESAVQLVAVDADGDPLEYTILTPPAHGTLSGSGAVRIYTPTADYTGADALVFQVADGRGGLAQATVSIGIVATSGSLSVEVGEDQLLALPAKAALTGEVLESGVPAGPEVVVSWELVSGPGILSFQDSAALETLVTASAPGQYFIRLWAQNGAESNFDDLLVTFMEEPVAPENPVRSHRGTEFWLTFLARDFRYEPFEPIFMGTQLVITSEEETSITVDFIYSDEPRSESYDVVPGVPTVVEIDGWGDSGGDRYLLPDRIFDGAIHLVAEKPVTVHGMNFKYATTDGYLALPKSMLGKDYVVLAYGGESTAFSSGELDYLGYQTGDIFGSEFAVIATEDGTTVEITLTEDLLGYTSGVPYTKVLNSGEVYRIGGLADDVSVDLTGSRIHADKPVAVFAGHNGAHVPDAIGYTDHLIEQVPPTSTWGRVFHTIPVAGRQNGDLFRILASENNTTVAINGVVRTTLQASDFYELIIEEPSQIATTKPVLVAQFATGGDFDASEGDPFMCYVIPTVNFGKEYTLTAAQYYPRYMYDAPDYWGERVWQDYLNILVRSDQAGGISLDGELIDATEFTALGNTGFSYAQIPVEAYGDYHLSSEYAFGALLNGYGEYESYGIPGGIYSDIVDGGWILDIQPEYAEMPAGSLNRVIIALSAQNGAPTANTVVRYSVTGVNPQAELEAVTDENGMIVLEFQSEIVGQDIVNVQFNGLYASTVLNWLSPDGNHLPLVEITNGTTQIVHEGGMLALDAEIQDDGLPENSVLTVSWSQISGPGPVVFLSPTTADCEASFTEFGWYKLRITVSDGALSNYDDIIVNYNALPRVGVAAGQTSLLVGSQVSRTSYAYDVDGNIQSSGFFLLSPDGNLSTNTTPPNFLDNGSVYYFLDLDLDQVGDYYILGFAVDNFGGVGESELYQITSRPAMPPTFNVSSPVAGGVYRTYSPVRFQVHASDPDEDYVQRLQIYINNQLKSSAYQKNELEYTFTPYTPGEYTVRVSAEDPDYLSTTSTFTFQVVDTLPAEVHIKGIDSGAEVESGMPVPLQVEFSGDPPSSVQEVRYFANGQLIAQNGESPYTMFWQPAKLETVFLTAQAHLGDGSVLHSEPLQVNVRSGVQIAFSANVLSVDAGHDRTVYLQVNGNPVSIDHYDYYVDSQLLSQSSDSHFTLRLDEPRTYHLRADALDSHGNVLSSAQAIAEVREALEIEIEFPEMDSVWDVGMTIPIAISYSGADEGIQSADLLVNGEVLGSIPESGLVEFVPGEVGEYELSAVVTDGTFRTRVSAPVFITAGRSVPIQISSPVAGVELENGDEVGLTVEVEGNPNEVEKYEFFANGEKIGENLLPGLTWRPVFVGTYELTARSIARFGFVADADPVSVEVIQITDPSVEIVQPLAETEIDFGQSVSISATASAGTSPVSRVDLYADGEFIAGAEGSAASAQWQFTRSGVHRLLAMVTAEDGRTAFSSAAIVRVLREPVNTELPAITGVNVQTLSPTSAQIGWTLPGNLPDGTTVVVERRLGDSESWEEIAEVTNGSGYVDNSLDAETYYEWRVSYRDNAGGSMSPASSSGAVLTGVQFPTYTVIDISANILESLDGDQQAMNDLGVRRMELGGVFGAAGVFSQGGIGPINLDGLQALGISDNEEVLFMTADEKYFVWSLQREPVEVNAGGETWQGEPLKFTLETITEDGTLLGQIDKSIPDPENTGEKIGQFHAAKWTLLPGTATPQYQMTDITPNLQLFKLPKDHENTADDSFQAFRAVSKTSDGWYVGSGWITYYYPNPADPDNPDAEPDPFRNQHALMWKDDQFKVLGHLTVPNAQAHASFARSGTEVIGTSANPSVSDLPLDPSTWQHKTRVFYSQGAEDTTSPYEPDLIALPTLGGDYSWAWDSNISLQTVGYSTLAEEESIGPRHAVLWQRKHAALPNEFELVRLPELGGVSVTAPNSSSSASGISNDGYIVGAALSPSGETHGTLWLKSKEKNKPLGAPDTTTYAVKDYNDILIEEFRSQWTILRADSINDDNIAMGYGRRPVLDEEGNSSYVYGPVLLMPFAFDLTPKLEQIGAHGFVDIVFEVNESMSDFKYFPTEGSKIEWELESLNTEEAGNATLGEMHSTLSGGKITNKFQAKGDEGYGYVIKAIITELKRPDGTILHFTKENSPFVVRSQISISSPNFIARLDDAVPPRYRKVALNGVPLGDGKPQSDGESDYESAETYIDALNLSLISDATDLGVSVPASDLGIFVRRSATSEVAMDRSGLRPEERLDKAFGYGWTSNLSAGIHFVYQKARVKGTATEADFAYVTTDDGTSHRFAIIHREDGTEAYYPVSNGALDNETFLCTLTRSGNILTFRKQHGTKIVFQMIGRELEVPKDRLRQYSSSAVFNGELHKWARLTSVEDRIGNRIQYSFSRVDTLIPSVISAVGRPGLSISIQQENGLVKQISDPKGNSWHYTYETVIFDPLPDGQNITGDLRSYSFPVLTDVTGPENLHFHYGYDALEEPDNAPTAAITPTRYFHIDVGSITNSVNQTFTFEYELDHTRTIFSTLYGGYFASGQPRLLYRVTIPGGHVTELAIDGFTMLKPTPEGMDFEAQRITYLQDADGNLRSYEFLNPQMIQMNQVKPYADRDLAEHPLEVPRMVIHSGMKVTSPAGEETYQFNLDAGLALESSTDLSGNVTRFEYGDTWSVSSNNPQLDGIGYTFGRYPEPTRQINALGGVKTMSYTGAFRQMDSVTDEEGRRTVHLIDDKGRRTESRSYSKTGVLMQITKLDYSTAFPSFVTRQTVKKLGGDPTWAKDLVTEFVPDSRGRVYTTIVDPQGLNLRSYTEYDANNNVVKVTDPRGNITTTVYDGMNRPVEMHFPAAGLPAVPSHIEIVYDAQGRKIRETDERGNRSLYVYDSLGRMIKSARDMDGNGVIDDPDLVTSMTYNFAGSVLTATDPEGNTTTNEYDAIHRLTATTDAAGNRAELYYGENSGGSVFSSSSFKPTYSIDARGYQQFVTYDALYRPLNTYVEYDQANEYYAITGLTYDKTGLLLTETDPLQRVTHHEYDGLGREFRTTYPDRTTSLVTYTGTGLAWKAKDQLGRESETEFDAAGRAVLVRAPSVTIRPDGSSAVETLGRPVSRTEYDAASNVIATIDPRGFRTDFAYDARNRLVSTTLPQVWDEETQAHVRPVSSSAYDAVGNVIAVTDPRGQVSQTEYDAANRPFRSTSPEVPIEDGVTMAQPITLSTYDKNGNVLTITDPLLNVTTNEYDVLNRLVLTTDAEGQITRFEYDAAGNRTAVIDGESRRTELTYDGLNRQLTQTDAQGRTATSLYDQLNLRATIDEMGRRRDYTYDNMNRLIAVRHSGRATDDRIYEYDAGGNLLEVTEPAHGNLRRVAYTYDALNRVTSEFSNGHTHTYRYDEAGNRTFANQAGEQIFSEYDALNRVTTITHSWEPTRFAYDAAGREVKRTNTDGSVSATTYDALGRRLRQVYRRRSTPNADRIVQEHRHDLAGNLRWTRQTTEGTFPYLTTSIQTMEYDGVYRLVRDTADTDGLGAPDRETLYGYDQANNRVSKQERKLVNVPGIGLSSVTTSAQYAVNNLNQITSWTEREGVLDAGGAVRKTVNYTFDLAGNRSSRTELDAGGSTARTTSYQWDYQNRLVQVGDGGTVAPSSGQSANYLWDYDYRTRRVKRAKVPQTTGAAVEQVNFVFSGGQSVKELFGGSWTQDLTYIRGSDWGGGIGGILYVKQGSNSYYNHYNNRGDIVLQTQRYGSETFQAQYEGFGTRTAQSGTKRGRQGANTKDEETELNLLNEGFRYRDLETGAFLSRDPAGFIDGPNLYAYVLQSPWSKFDPEGLFWAEVGYFGQECGSALANTAKRVGAGLADLAVFAFGDLPGYSLAVASDILSPELDVRSHFEGSSSIFKSIADNPQNYSEDQLRSAMISMGVEMELNIITFGLWSLGNGIGEGAATGDYTQAQDAAFSILAFSAMAKARGYLNRGVKPGDQSLINDLLGPRALKIGSEGAKVAGNATLGRGQSGSGRKTPIMESKGDGVNPAPKSGHAEPQSIASMNGGGLFGWLRNLYLGRGMNTIAVDSTVCPSCRGAINMTPGTRAIVPGNSFGQSPKSSAQNGVLKQIPVHPVESMTSPRPLPVYVPGEREYRTF